MLPAAAPQEGSRQVTSAHQAQGAEHLASRGGTCRPDPTASALSQQPCHPVPVCTGTITQEERCEPLQEWTIRKRGHRAPPSPSVNKGAHTSGSIQTRTHCSQQFRRKDSHQHRSLTQMINDRVPLHEHLLRTNACSQTACSAEGRFLHAKAPRVHFLAISRGFKFAWICSHLKHNRCSQNRCMRNFMQKLSYLQI